MSLTADAILLLASMGLTVEEIAGVARANATNPATKEQTPSSSKAADRMRKYRQNRIDNGLDPVFRGSAYHADLKARDGDMCVYCTTAKGTSVDHMVPVSRGGTDHIDNLALACNPCNGGKMAKMPGEKGYVLRAPGAAAAHVRYLREHAKKNREPVREQREHNHEPPTPLVPPSLSPGPPNPPPYNPPSPPNQGADAIGLFGDGSPPLPAVRPKTKSRVKREATELPKDWGPSDEDWNFASSEGLTGPQIDREAQKFKDYWKTTAKNATKADWPATWRNWIRRLTDDPKWKIANGQQQPAWDAQRRTDYEEFDAASRAAVGFGHRR